MDQQRRRAPVQADHIRHDSNGNTRRLRIDEPGGAPGTIAWDEHEQVWSAYARRYGRDQNAERIAERGGFSFDEITQLTGAPPRTWKEVVRLDRRDE